MTGTSPQRTTSSPRVLVLSMFFSPCGEVGGKRFTYLSKYLSKAFPAYHVLARKERIQYEDNTAFHDNVHRTGMFPYFPPARSHGIWQKLGRLWAKWLCQIDPYIGWVIPATIKGIRLCRKYRLNVVLVTVPTFSSMIAAVLVSKATGGSLVLDYRDEWTNHVVRFRRPFGKYLCPMVERMAIRQASAVVVCTETMLRDFLGSFSGIGPRHLEIIHNGYEEMGEVNVLQNRPATIKMLYAGNLYGKRQLSMIAPALVQLLQCGVIAPQTFRLHLYTKLKPEEYSAIERSGIGEIVEFHEPVAYEEIRKVMRSADILFLPSGQDFNYAVPFKFYDYLSARRPILAVASKQSAVLEMMKSTDCGVFAEIDNHEEIRRGLEELIRGTRRFSFSGADRFRWSSAADQYVGLMNKILT